MDQPPREREGEGSQCRGDYFGERVSAPVQVTIMANCQILLTAAGILAVCFCDQAHKRLEKK